jgi:ABC-type transporter lipoprotein component MlaA
MFPAVSIWIAVLSDSFATILQEQSRFNMTLGGWHGSTRCRYLFLCLCGRMTVRDTGFGGH